MSDVEFEEGTQAHLRYIDISKAVSHNTPLIIKWGWVKNIQQANLLMLVTIVVCIVLSIGIFVLRQQGDTLYKEDFTIDEINRMHPDMRNSLPNKK